MSIKIPKPSFQIEIDYFYKKNNVDIKFSGQDNNIHQVAQSWNTGKPNNLKVFGSIKPKGLNQIALDEL